MDATDRIAQIFDRLVQLGRSASELTSSERIVYYVVATRCEIGVNGFASVYEQHLVPEEFEILIDGLDRISESSLADEFQRGYDVLKSATDHATKNQSTPPVMLRFELRLLKWLHKPSPPNPSL